MSALPSSAVRVRAGVPPLRAGQGTSFVLRRLHSLSGIVPVGAFLVEHFLSNAFATNGPQAYGNQVKFLTGLPFTHLLEIFGIYIPLLYHALYGFYVWYRGESNLAEYPWIGNRMYTAQRWTGAVAFAYILYHTWEMRFTGVSLFENPAASFGKVQRSFENPWVVAFYVVGVVAASWHFAYGLWLFAAKWGLTVGERSRRHFGVVCFGIAVLFISVGLYTVRSFFQWPTQPIERPAAQAVEKAPAR